MKTALRTLKIGVAAGLIVVLSVVVWFNAQLPPLKTLKAYEPALITKVFDRHGEMITEYAAERRLIVALEDMPQHLIDAFIAAEDGQFYNHIGIDILGIVRAAFNMVVARQIQGGASTITQQVARSFFLTQQRKFSRKIKEILLALKLERHLSKDEILFLYLNQIYLGRGAYGVGAASQVYFGIEPRELTVAQAALIAGLPPAPSRYAPHLAPEKARNRQLYVLRRMVENGFLSPEEATATKSQRVAVKTWSAPSWNSPWLDAVVRGWLLDRFPEDAVMYGGLRVYTTFDLAAEEHAEMALRTGLEDLDKRQGYRGPITTDPASTWPRHLARARSQLNKIIIKREKKGVINWVGPPATQPVENLRPVTDILQPSDLFSGVVTGMTSKGKMAWVDFGLGTGRLVAEGMLWARVPSLDVGAGRELIDRPSRRLKVGSVIWARKYSHEYVERFEIGDRERGKAMKTLDKLVINNGESRGSLLLLLEQKPKAQGALASVLPQSGEIIALVGGYDFSDSQFNRATQAKRQPGSAFKPIVYNAALDHGFTPASILVDKPLVYKDQDTGETWKPKNYSGKFYGPMTLVDALTLSRNVVTIQLVKKMRIRTIQERARDLGLEGELPPDLSMALGSGVVTPLNMVRPYATFANGGKRPEISFIREVWDAAGNVIYSYTPPVTAGLAQDYDPFVLAPRPVSRDVPFGFRQVDTVYASTATEFPQVISPETAYQTTYLLRNVVERGTGWRARKLGRPTAGKTGTTDENIDSWFVGYTCDYATSVWVGFDQLQPLGRHETGSRSANPIWTDYMLQIQKGLPVCDFPVPKSINFKEIDAKSGQPASPWTSNKVLLMPFKPDDFATPVSGEVTEEKSSVFDFLQGGDGFQDQKSDW